MKELETGEFYQFGTFRVDVKKRRLLRADEIVPLTPKEFELLLALVRSAGRVVEKDELLEEIWKDTFVEEGTLTRNISWLRKKLAANSADELQFIETLPKRGYRFLPAVTKSGAEKALVVAEQTVQRIRIEETISLPEQFPTGAETSIAVAPTRAAPPRRLSGVTKNSIWLWLMVGVAALAGIGFFAYQYFFRPPARSGTILVSKVAPFSGLLGREDAPAFSPDGRQLAFAWNGGEGEDFHVYVKLIGMGEPLRLTNSPQNDFYPVFSPDARQIAFVRAFASHYEVLVVPALGGAERKICSLATGASISFSPDGRTLAVVDLAAPGKQFVIWLVNVQTGEKRPLTAPGEASTDNTPRFSPDGAQVAFLRSFGDFVQELMVVPMTGGEPRQLTFDKSKIRSLAWSADGKQIGFVSLRSNNQANLWQLPAAGGAEPELIATDGKNIRNMALSPNGRTIAFVEETEDTNIWRIAPDVPARKFIASTRADHSPHIAPDGARIVFVSDRTGHGEIWLADAAGKNQRQLTDSPYPAGSPRVSPDGKFVAFDAQVGDNDSRIFVGSIEGGEPRQLTDGGGRDVLPAWSADGQWIYFTSNRTGAYQLWRTPATGGAAQQITRQGAFESFAAPDGRTIYYSKGRGSAGLWRTATEGGDEAPVAELAAAGYWRSWTVTQHGFFFVARTLNPPYQINFYDFANKQIKEIATVEKPPLWIFAGLSAAADGKLILYAQQDQNASGIMLAELGH